MKAGGLTRVVAQSIVSALVVLTPLQVEGQGAGGAPALSGTERRIAAAVDQRNAEALALLERVVSINSGTMNFEGVRKVGDAFKAELDALGFSTKWVDGSGFRRAGHLVAERNGRGPRILLIGHLDTVFEPRSPFQKFERLTDSTARGPLPTIPIPTAATPAPSQAASR